MGDLGPLVGALQLQRATNALRGGVTNRKTQSGGHRNSQIEGDDSEGRNIRTNSTHGTHGEKNLLNRDKGKGSSSRDPLLAEGGAPTSRARGFVTITEQASGRSGDLNQEAHSCKSREGGSPHTKAFGNIWPGAGISVAGSSLSAGGGT